MDVTQKNLALLNWSMICPHPQPFSLGRREPELLFPLPRATVYAQVKKIFEIGVFSLSIPPSPLTKGETRVQSPPEFGGFRRIDRPATH